MKWWQLWKREAEPRAEPLAQVGWTGEEVRVNPTDPQALDRNSARIRTLTHVLAGPVHESKRAGLEAELRRRLAAQPREG